MWFNINWNKLALQNLPTLLRKPYAAFFSQVLLKPIISLYNNWFQWRDENLYKLSHTGQVCKLRQSLNDRFDPALRRIYIGDAQFYDTTYIYTEAEAQDVYVNTEAEEPTIWLRTEAETADTGLDFIVFVPEQIFNTQIHGLRAHIDFYKAGGKRYNIFIDE